MTATATCLAAFVGLVVGIAFERWRFRARVRRLLRAARPEREAAAIEVCEVAYRLCGVTVCGSGPAVSPGTVSRYLFDYAELIEAGMLPPEGE